ncbi:acetamidase [Geopyxis carbonaria]|nr:acetamidase [Geopyxis carbonaria]
MPLLNYLRHKDDCKFKQESRAETIANLPPAYHDPLTLSDKSILDSPVERTAALVRKGEWKPIDVLRSYGKRALTAHAQTNCLTEVLLSDAEEWLAHSTAYSQADGGVNLSGPLAGVPVSVKDTINVTGHDSCIGYSRWVNKPARDDAPIIRLLKDAGAVPFVKTNVPITLLSFESTNDVFGRTDNPHVPGFSPGGSSGGEGALIALGGSRIGIGTDVAGSVRNPAAWSGLYTVRCSTGRFPRSGNVTSMAGQEGVAAVYSPMARTLPDLTYFLKSIIDQEPWEYDHTVHPIPWRADTPPSRSVRWGVLATDGIVPPTPAITRALATAAAALRETGQDELIDLTDCPSPYTGLRLASRLLNSDGTETFRSHFRSAWETTDPAAGLLAKIFRLPRFVKRLYAWYLRTIMRDPVSAGLIDDLHPRSVAAQWELVAQREAYRAKWHSYLQEKDIDFILTPANATPAIPAGSIDTALGACGYTFLWNLVDYTAGVIPVGHVDRETDAVVDGMVPDGANGVHRKVWGLYDADKMHGLPTAVQIVGGRLQEEKVLWGMERVQRALTEAGTSYQGIEVDVD